MGIFLAIIGTWAMALSTPDFWKCTGKVGGSWLPAQNPNACNVSDFGDPKSVQSNYTSVIYSDAKSSASQLPAYMNNMNADIRDAATYYYQIRNVGSTGMVLNDWLQLVMATAFQESMWSHYRLGNDKLVKMMRGDSGHGHGMMQIDDRDSGHYNALLKNSAGWELSQNIVNGLDELFNDVKLAKKSKCATNSQNLARAAYSDYNGGPGNECRWQNANSSWARNDVNFLNNYKSKLWNNYVTNTKAISTSNMSCLMEKTASCSAQPVRTTASITVTSAPHLYDTSDGSICALVGQSLNCVKTKDVLCLKQSLDLSGDAVSLPQQLQALPRKNLDRHTLCQTIFKSMASVSEFVKTDRDIFVRSAPQGAELTTVQKNSLNQVLDFQIEDNGDLYYGVQVNNRFGYFYAGNVLQNVYWATEQLDSMNDQRVIATHGHQVQITLKSGLNVYNKIGGSIVSNLKLNDKVVVDTVEINSDNNEVYYQVITSKGPGYIFSGHILPTMNLKQWTRNLN